MSGLLVDILSFFEQYPGDLVFFLVIIALAQASLYFAFGQRRRFPEALSPRRYFVAATVLIGLWILILAAAIVALLIPNEPGSLLPPLERLAQTLSVALLAWALLAADEDALNKPGNLSALGMALIALLFFLYTAIQWNNAFTADAEFNKSVFAPVWSALPVAIASAGLLLTLLNAASIEDAPLKGLFFLLIVLGNGWDLYQFSETVVAGNYLGGARLAYMGALFLIPLLMYRQAIALLTGAPLAVASTHAPASALSLEQTQASPEEAAPADEAQASENGGGAIEALLAAIGMILDDDEASPMSQRLTLATISLLEVKLCLFLRKLDSHYADLTAGYDAVSQQSFSGLSFKLDAQPGLRRAFADGQSVTLASDANAGELAALFAQLDIAAPDMIHVQPVTSAGDTAALLLVGSPLRDEGITTAQTALLQVLAKVAGQALDRERQAEAALAAGRMEASNQAVDSAEIAKARRQLESGIQQTLQDNADLRASNAELLTRLRKGRSDLLSNLRERAGGASVAEQVASAFAEQSRLWEASEKTASALLDGEIVLRILDADNDDEPRQVILDYIQNSYQLQVDSRHRLQSQLDALQEIGEPLAQAEPSALFEALADESRRLEKDMNQLEARQAEVLAAFESIGIDAELGNLAQVLIQHYAEQSALNNAVTAMARQRDLLRKEQSQLNAIHAQDLEALRNQLKRLSAEHESLLEQREGMRRAHEDLLGELEAKATEAANLEDKRKHLRQQLSASAAQREQFKDLIVNLTEERDNLLRIRDQLTNRLAASLEEAEKPADSTLRMEVSELSALVNDLSNQRERLEAELRDLRSESAGEAADAKAPEESAVDDDSQQKDIQRLMEDLKSPVTAIMDGTDILLAERIGILGAAQLRVLQNVSDNIVRFTEIIDELRQVCKLSSESYTLSYSDADLVALLDEALGKHSELLRRKGLAIDLSLGDALPKAPMDTACVSRILDQLLGNACEVSDAGSQIHLTLEVSRQALPGMGAAADILHLQVSDHGGGIDPEDIKRLFARKYKTENPKIKGYSDTGVGLTVSQALARAHGGDVWITSESGVGSTVHLALPISPSMTTEA